MLQHVIDLFSFSPIYLFTLYEFTGDFFPEEYRIKDEPDPDVRISQEEADKMVDAKNEFYEDEKDNDKEPVVENKDP